MEARVAAKAAKKAEQAERRAEKAAEKAAFTPDSEKSSCDSVLRQRPEQPALLRGLPAGAVEEGTVEVQVRFWT